MTFRPLRVQDFLNDDCSGDIRLYFGSVDCPGCDCHVEVSAPAEGASGYCPNCAWHIPVAVAVEHLRMDDSRPASSGYGCVCGNPRCPGWGTS